MEDELLRREAVRLYRRYQTEIVEGLKLCPWAERTRREERVRERVALGATLDVEATLETVADLGADPAVEIGLILFPRVDVTPSEFERFVSQVFRTDAERYPTGEAPFAMAAFHPDGRLDTGDAERLIAFLRRTPDPTIQLVRHASLDRVREGSREGTQFIDIEALGTLELTRDDTLPLRERIARANLRTVERLGLPELERRLSAIRADRDAAYAGLSVERRDPCPSR